jgi:hypothetical protein
MISLEVVEMGEVMLSEADLLRQLEQDARALVAVDGETSRSEVHRRERSLKSTLLSLDRFRGGKR